MAFCWPSVSSQTYESSLGSVLGMFSSGLLVEVMDRYFIPILAMMFLAGLMWKYKGEKR